jgi:hypothetical protein
VLGRGVERRCPARTTSTWAGMFEIGMCVAQATITVQLSWSDGGLTSRFRSSSIQEQMEKLQTHFGALFQQPISA